jgi:S1-C subfamily serine protease
MRHQLSWAIALLVLCGAAAADDVTPAIVKIYTTYQKPDWVQPWQKEAAKSRTGSGCIIDGNRILTNAHVVGDGTFIQVRRAGRADKFVAQVAAVSHELDLALLRVEDAAFFEGAKPLSIGELPRIGDHVVAYGFPKGGTRVTITRGVVSRIDRQRYSHSSHENLVCQIDAAINSGSSGGPVLDKENRIRGVAFQVSEGENTGYIVPAPVLKHLLHDLEDGRVDGSPVLPIWWQYLENRAQREILGLDPGQSGVVVRGVFPRGTGLQSRDVILKIDGHVVGSDGTIELRPGERIALGYTADRRQINERIPLELLRDGKVVKLDLALTSPKQSYPYVVARYAYEKRPSYFVIGGLIFSPLTANYFSEWDDWKNVPVRLRKYWHESRTVENAWRREVVACIGLLPDRLNAGYAWMEDWVVVTVNGKRIGSMRELIESFESHEGPYHRIVVEPDNYEVVLPRAETAERNPAILSRYGVPADRSPDLRKTTAPKKKSAD